jgi:hypothetical protein
MNCRKAGKQFDLMLYPTGAARRDEPAASQTYAADDDGFYFEEFIKESLRH